MTSSTPSVLITGGGMGLGLAIVKELLQGSKHSPPANVYTLTMAVSDEFKELVSQSEGRLAYAIGDVTKFEDSKKAVDDILSRWHRLDGVVVNAGITNLAPLEDLDYDTMLKTLSVNAAAPVNTLRAALPELRKHKGRVVFVTSSSSHQCHPTWAPYSCSKAALNSLALTLANEEPDIASFAVSPGHVDTAMQSKIRSTDESFEKLYQEHKLLPAEKPAAVLAALVMRGSRSEPAKHGKPLGAGAFVSWDDPALKEYHE